MTKDYLRIIFMGTPEFAVETLQALVQNNYNVVAVVTQPDKPVGRHGSVLQPSPVKVYAQKHNIPVMQPEKMKDETFIKQLRSYNANLQVVVAFRMLPEIVWNMPEFGTFNVHAALLPQYRGAAPINWAIINGEKQTGVTTFFLDHNIDTGRIIMQKTFDIADNYNVEDVYQGLMRLGAEICLETIDKILITDGLPESIPQEKLLTAGQPLHNAPKIFKETCRIDWNMPAYKIYNFIRGLSPYPGTWTVMTDAHGKETVMKIYSATKTAVMSNMPAGTIQTDKKQLLIATANGEMLQINEVQIAGKKRMRAQDFINGQKNIEDYTVK